MWKEKNNLLFFEYFVILFIFLPNFLFLPFSPEFNNLPFSFFLYIMYCILLYLYLLNYMCIYVQILYMVYITCYIIMYMTILIMLYLVNFILMQYLALFLTYNLTSEFLIPCSNFTLQSMCAICESKYLRVLENSSIWVAYDCSGRRRKVLSRRLF